VRTWTLVIGIVLLAPLATAAQALPADCPAKPPSEDDARALAGNWFVKAEGLYKKERYEDALGAFLCSLNMAEHPNTYFNAAQTAVTTGEKALALDLARKCLKLKPAEPLATKARELVEQLENELPTDSPPVVAETEPEPEEEPIEGPEEPDVAPEPEPEPEPEPTDGEGANLAVPGYVLLGVGAAGLVVGAVLQGLTGKAQTESEETDDYQVFKDKKDSGEAMQKAAIACFVVGGVVAATGLVLVIADGGGEEQSTEVALVPGPGGLMIEGSF